MDIRKQISDCIINMDEENIEALIRQAIEEEIDLEDIYEEGLNHGMRKALKLYENKEYDVPEIIVCADTLNKAIKLLDSLGKTLNENKEKVLLAVVEGDTHEIGKNIVKIMLEAAGFEVIDMGVNQTAKDIMDRAVKERVKIIGLSSMMTTTRGEMKTLIDMMKDMDMKDKPYVILGGGSITSNYSREIKADGYGVNAPEAIKLIENLLGGE